MDILEVNGLLNAAEEKLNDDLEYKRWLAALIREREEAARIGYDTSKLEAVLYELYALKIGRIVDN